MDMISDLSDDLLLNVLSSLPTRDVVGTMLLSKVSVDNGSKTSF